MTTRRRASPICEARYYDPVTARFLSTDPVGFVESGGDPRFINRYVYVHNDPVNLNDPTGQCPMCIGAAISVGLELAVLGVEKFAGKEISLKEAAVRVGASAVSGAAGVGVVTKVKSIGKASSAIKKLSIPAGNGNDIKIGNAASGAFEGAVSGTTSEIVGAELKQAGGVGEGASFGSVVTSSTIGGLTGGISGSASNGDFTAGDSVAAGVKPSPGETVSAQVGIVEKGVDLITAPKNVAQEEHKP